MCVTYLVSRRCSRISMRLSACDIRHLFAWSLAAVCRVLSAETVLMYMYVRTCDLSYQQRFFSYICTYTCVARARVCLCVFVRVNVCVCRYTREVCLVSSLLSHMRHVTHVNHVNKSRHTHTRAVDQSKAIHMSMRHDTHTCQMACQWTCQWVMNAVDMSMSHGTHTPGLWVSWPILFDLHESHNRGATFIRRVRDSWRARDWIAPVSYSNVCRMSHVSRVNTSWHTHIGLAYTGVLLNRQWDMCAMIRLHVRHNRVPWLVHTQGWCAMTHSHVWHDYVSWRVDTYRAGILHGYRLRMLRSHRRAARYLRRRPLRSFALALWLQAGGVVQYVAVCGSVLQYVAVYCSVLLSNSLFVEGLYVAVCCSVLQCVAVCCSVLLILSSSWRG